MEELLDSDTLVIDACRNVVREQGRAVSLATRPVLSTLARVLGEAWPGEAPRNQLLVRAFRARDTDDSHRARLRVEMGRLRVELREFAEVGATKHGLALRPRRAERVVVLAPLADEQNTAVLALLQDGEAWSSSGLALALGTSSRSVQRALDALASADRVQSFGRGPARRWVTPPVPGFPTVLLLPAPPPGS